MKISVVAGSTAATSSVKVTGTRFGIISDKEREIFDITDGPLKDAVNKYFGKKPNSVYVKSPTPWNDLYKTYHWQEVTYHLEVKSSKVVGLEMEPVSLTTKEFSNQGNTKATFTADLNDTVTQTTETNWSETHGFEVGEKISYEVDFPGAKMGGELSMSYSSEFGKGGSESKQVAVSSSSGVSLELEPGKRASVSLTANRGTLDIEIVYRISLTGSTAVNYNPKYKGHHFYSLGINGVLSKAGKTRIYEITQTLKVGYYSTGKVEVVTL